MPAIVLSVNVGRPKPAEWAGIGHTSIDKHTVTGPVTCGELGLEGDQVSDTKHHGGVDKAVYAFAREDLDLWEHRLHEPIRNGQFGENLTTSGIDVNEALVGERWRVGTAVLEIRSFRTPCNDFKNWMGLGGYDNAQWVKRFTKIARPGPYLSVVEPGVLAVGDPIEVVHRPDHGISVTTMFKALTTDRHLLPQLLTVDGLVEEARRTAEEYVAAYA